MIKNKLREILLKFIYNRISVINENEFVVSMPFLKYLAKKTIFNNKFVLKLVAGISI